MMERTDRHCRFFLRLITRHTLLYTEMVTTAAVLHGDRDKLLAYEDAEHPLALQLGGSNPGDLAECARIAEESGFDEVNMNVGCPSKRVRAGQFGACLMAEPDLVAECVAAMIATVAIPVTVKTRIGIDERDSYAALAEFVSSVSQAGCSTFIVHARKAWLSGLSPKENRSVPPLRYDVIEKLKEDFPQLGIVLNGGVESLDGVCRHLRKLNGVMIGREAYQNPYMLARADALVFEDDRRAPGRRDIVERFVPYVERELTRGTRFGHLARHVMGLYLGVPGARAWRRALSMASTRADATALALLEAIPAVTDDVADAA